MKENLITFTTTGEDKIIAFEQSEFGFEFKINGQTFLKVDKWGDCYKHGDLIENDVELFEVLKNWFSIFNETYNNSKFKR